MKKNIIISIFLATVLMTVGYTAKSMVSASIGVPECMACGTCYEYAGVPFFPTLNGTAWFGIYDKYHEEFDMHFYDNPTPSHQDVIRLAKDICPSACIMYVP